MSLEDAREERAELPPRRVRPVARVFGTLLGPGSGAGDAERRFFAGGGGSSEGREEGRSGRTPAVAADALAGFARTARCTVTTCTVGGETPGKKMESLWEAGTAAGGAVEIITDEDGKGGEGGSGWMMQSLSCDSWLSAMSAVLPAQNFACAFISSGLFSLGCV